MRSSAKKGVDYMEIVPYAVVAIVVFIASILVIKNLGYSFEESGNLQTCKFSVLQKAKFIIGKIDVGNFELKCPTAKVNLLDSKDDKVKREKNIFVKDQEDVKRAVANEMYDCWSKFGEGKVLFVSGFHISQQAECYMCSNILFGKNAAANTKIGNEIRNFDEYLAKEKVPARNVTYWEYFTGSIRTDASKGSINLEIDKPIAVTFNVVRKSIWGDILKSAPPGFAAGAGVGAVGLLGSNPVGWAVAAGAAVVVVGGTIFSVQDEEATAFVGVSSVDDVKECNVL